MFQSRAMQNFPGTCWKCSPFLNEVETFTQKIRVCCVQTKVQPKVLRVSSKHRFYPSIYQGSGFTPLCAYAISERSFCNVPESIALEKNSLSLKDGKNRSKSFFWMYKKDQKEKAQMASASHGENNTSINGVEHSFSDNSQDQALSNENMALAMDLPSSSTTINQKKTRAKGKQKKLSESPEIKEKSLGINAISEEVTLLGVSKKVSQSKKTHRTKNNKPPIISEVGSEAHVPTETTLPIKPPSKGKARKSKKKEKSNKETIPDSKLDEETTGINEMQEPHVRVESKLQGEKEIRQLYPASAKSVMVVESSVKANVIQRYLGDMFEVIPSYGHVRDLAGRSGSVRPDEDFSMVWEVPSAAWTHLKSIQVALSGAKNLVLASDPDREGEAIAWHIIEMLQQQGALNEDIFVARVVFNEITESSIKKALQSPRSIDVNLVHSYLARRALDYLIGFNISPLLWKKLPGCQSAGRVQSAALSLICDREKEIDEFKPHEYWKVEVEFSVKDSFGSYLTHYNSTKLDNHSISTHDEASNIEGEINSCVFEVSASNKSVSRRNPSSPYRTSTLQQDAANKLHFPTAYTMKLAQKLYEGVQLMDDQATGLITYMRTDGLNISDDAAKDIQSFVRERYGHNFASNTPRKYFKKVKNAQEAHEAIRPTSIRRLPSGLAQVLDEDSLKLYTLIWSRTIACQMEPGTLDQIQIEICNENRSILFRSSASKVGFLGYQAVFKDIESRAIRSDEDEKDNSQDVFEVLSALKDGDVLNLCKIQLDQHFTSPPPRYNEGSLVKKLEELGIGRPSTYASTIKVLKDRNYVAVKSRVLSPEFRGRMVSAYLSHFFSDVTEYSFTADMETELDNVSSGVTEWKRLLNDYWTRFSKHIVRASGVHIHQVEKMLEKAFGDVLFASLPDGSRTCPSCLEGTLIFKVSRFGAGYFIGCDQHPKCKHIAKTLYREEDEDTSFETKTQNVEPPKLLGLNPSSNDKVFLKHGPYGYYVQLGEDGPGYSPKRASVSQIKDVSTITIEDALDLLKYPVTLGKHPEDGWPVTIMNKNGGYSIKHRRTRAPVPKNMKPGDVTLEKALKLLLSKDATRSGRPKSEPKPEESLES